MNKLDFLKALKAGDYDTAKQVILDINQQGSFDIDEPAVKGMAPLQWAVLQGSSEAVSWLLDAGADVNVTTERKGETPLISAIRVGNRAAINVLLDAGADVDKKDKANMSPLARAIQNSKSPIALSRMLLDAGADPSVSVGRGGNSVAMLLIGEQNPELLDVFQGRGLDPNKKNDAGETCAHVLARGINPAFIAAFIEKNPGIDLNEPSKSGRPPLFFIKHPDAAIFFVKAGADPTARSDHNMDCGATAMAYLASLGAAHMLAEHQNPEDFFTQDNSGETAISRAVKAESPNSMASVVAMVDVIREYKPSLLKSPIDAMGTSPYEKFFEIYTYPRKDSAMLAAHYVESLLEAGVPIEANFSQGNMKGKVEEAGAKSFLNLAIEKSYPQVVSFALEKGCDIGKRAPNGDYPVHAVLGLFNEDRLENLKIEKRSRKYGSKKNKLVKNESGSGFKVESVDRIDDESTTNKNDILKLLDDAGIRKYIDRQDKHGDTLLMLAAKTKNLEVAQWALSKGASIYDGVRVSGSEGVTPLLVAACNEADDVYNEMLGRASSDGKEISISLTNWVLLAPDEGDSARSGFVAKFADLFNNDCVECAAIPAESQPSPVMAAAATGQSDLLQVLLRNGFDPDTPAKNGDTPLHYAILSGSADVARVLVKSGADIDAKASNGVSAGNMAAAAKIDLHLTKNKPKRRVS